MSDEDSDASVGQGGASDSEGEDQAPAARQYKFSDGSDDDSDHNDSKPNKKRSRDKSESASGSADEDEEFQPRGKPSTGNSKPDKKLDEAGSGSTITAERIPPVLEVGHFRFQRVCKKRPRNKSLKGFDVEYKIVGNEDSSGRAVFRSKSQLLSFFQKEGLEDADESQFDFSQKYDEQGELTDHGKMQIAGGPKAVNKGGAANKKKKRKGRELLDPRSQKKPKQQAITDDHPLSRCVQILRDVMAKREAPPFLEPVDLKLYPQYLEAVKEPMDLGTVYDRLCQGVYQTAHEVRRDCSLVWLNCSLFNGDEASITKDVKKLAKVFDDKFLDQIPAPTHMGMRKFTHGAQWVGHAVTVYFDDHRWYEGEILDYDESKTEDNYKIKYVDDDNCEWVSLPSIDITITDAWEALGKPIDAWQGVPAEQQSVLVASRPQRARNMTKQYVPMEGAGPSVGHSKGRKSKGAGGDGLGPETPEKERPEPTVQYSYAAEPRVDGEKRPEDFFCDDGASCGDVCRCRLLFWCRFKTRKGVILGTTKGQNLTGYKQQRCSYYLCPHPTVSSNDRWHYISPHTASGGRDWSELLGQTLCSSCFQQYRSKGTLLRVRDLPT